MRFKSRKIAGYRAYAVTGVNTVSFAIDFRGADTSGLLGFAVERHDPTENERYFIYGVKVFESVIPNPDELTTVRRSTIPCRASCGTTSPPSPTTSTSTSSIRSRATPKKLDRSAASRWRIRRAAPSRCSRPLEHDIFFNRGVASSQAYTREFGNKKPGPAHGPPSGRGDGVAEPPARRGAPEVHRRRRPGDTLLCCFYEFRYQPVGRGAEGARRSRRGRAADRRRQEQRAQGQERQGPRGFPARARTRA